MRSRCGWVVLAILGMVTFGSPGTAGAQTGDEERVALHVNFGYQAASESFREAIAFRAYGETARLDTSHDISGGSLFDAGGYLRVWRELSVGATFSQTDGTDATTVSGTVPHPTQTAADRAIDPVTLDLTHRERATHVHIGWRIPLSQDHPVDVRVMGGPTYFNLTQGAVGGAVISEAGGPPFAAVVVERVVTGDIVKNGWGGHVAVDVRYLISASVGVGGFVRFARGSVDLPVGDSAVTLSVGGVQMGGGLRVRF